MSKEPIDNIVWLPARGLRPNSWNPNTVFNTELALLEESILWLGWAQPILVTTEGIIIDGFHRWKLSMTSQKIQEKYAEEVPCVSLDITEDEAMMLTVRMNRAKGSHGALKMSEIVRRLIDEFYKTPEELVAGMGMTKGEITLLYDGSLLKRRDLQNHEYSKAWIPVETRLLTDKEKKQLEEQSLSFERDEE